jgi:hypothetical protein
MSAISVEVPFPVFYDRAGEPLENGYVWVGTANLNPQTNPVQVYFDKNLTQPAQQPLRTIAGYISNSGTPAQIYVDAADYSILVQDKNGTMIYNFPDGTGFGPSASGLEFTGFKGQLGVVQDIADNDGADWIGYQPSASTSIARSVQDKVREIVSVKDFGAVGNNVADDTNAFKNAISAITAGQWLYVPPGTYKITETLILNKQINLLGDGWDASRLFFTVPNAAAIQWTVNPFGSQFSGLRISSTLGKNSATNDIGLKGRENGSNRQWKIDRCYIDGFSFFGIMLHLGWNCTVQNSEIRNCGNATNFGSGIFIYDANGSTTGSTGHLFQNNYIAGCYHGISSASGIVPGFSGYAWNNTYINNIYESNTYPVRFINGGRQTFIKHYQEANTNPSVFNSGVFLDFISISSGTQTFPTGAVVLDKDRTRYQGVFQTDDTDFALKPLSRTGAQVGTGPSGTPIISGRGGKFVFGSSTPAYIWEGQFNATGTGDNATDSPAFSCIDADSASGTNNRFGAFLAANRDSRSPGGLPAGGRGGMMIWGNGTGNSTSAGSYVSFYTATNSTQDVEQIRIERNGNLRPARDNNQSSGTASFRWSVVYAATGTINTSDVNTKQDIEDLSEAEKRVAKSIKGLIKKFRFKDSVAEKGDAARIHIGVIAQELQTAFEAEGLDAHRYGLFCKDTWYEYEGKVVNVNENKKYVDGYMALKGEKISCDENGDYPEGAVWVDVEHNTVEKSQLSVRYEELLAFVLAAI